MTLAAMATDLRILLDKLKTQSLLEDIGELALQQAAAQLDAIPQPKKKGKMTIQATWDLKIPPSQPMLFVPSTEDPRLQPDLFCYFTGPSDDEWPWKKQSLVIRVWSNHEKLSSRVEWDSSGVLQALKANNWRRVMVRVHLDKADPSDPAPLHHMQVGGLPVEEDNELCWIPAQIRIPRFPYHPIDIILACEIIVANFFPREFGKLCADGEWQRIVTRAQERTLTSHSRICNDFCSHPDIYGNQTLLMRLWNKV